MLTLCCCILTHNIQLVFCSQDVADLIRSIKKRSPRTHIYDFACGVAKYISKHHPEHISTSSMGCLIPPQDPSPEDLYSQRVNLPHLCEGFKDDQIDNNQ